MINQLIRVGDVVIITIEGESRAWGYNPCPDGTRATVLGFTEIHYGRLSGVGLPPGVYANRSWVKLRLDDGREHTEYHGRLALADAAEYERRLVAFRAHQQEHPDDRGEEFLRELPETPFWEGDIVRVRMDGPEYYVVVHIDYANLAAATAQGPHPAYRIRHHVFGHELTVAADDVLLFERGRVWKFFHDEPITFRDLKEEAEFFDRLGHTDEVRNPASGLYAWAINEVLAAIRDGIAHGFTVSSGFFGTGPGISGKRFRNAELGARVAAATLAGFPSA